MTGLLAIKMVPDSLQHITAPFLSLTPLPPSPPSLANSNSVSCQTGDSCQIAQTCWTYHQMSVLIQDGLIQYPTKNDDGATNSYKRSKTELLGLEMAQGCSFSFLAGSPLYRRHILIYNRVVIITSVSLV